MGEQRNLTEENVTVLKEQLKKMQVENPDLEYSFRQQEGLETEPTTAKLWIDWRPWSECEPVNTSSHFTTCSVCGWTNTGLINLGEPTHPRMVCQGCCKRAVEAMDATPSPLTGRET